MRQAAAPRKVRCPSLGSGAGGGGCAREPLPVLKALLWPAPLGGGGEEAEGCASPPLHLPLAPPAAGGGGAVRRGGGFWQASLLWRPEGRAAFALGAGMLARRKGFLRRRRLLGARGRARPSALAGGKDLLPGWVPGRQGLWKGVGAFRASLHTWKEEAAAALGSATGFTGPTKGGSQWTPLVG